MNLERAQDALRILAEQAVEKTHQLSTYSVTPNQESDNEADSESPVVDSFYEFGGNDSILKMTNFTLPEFRRLYGIFYESITTSWNLGRGKRSHHTSMDVLFICIVVLKHGGSWNKLAHIFRVKGPTFMRLITGFMAKID